MKKLLMTLVVVSLLLTAAAPAFADTIYIVQPGDNLFRISLKFGVSQQAIMIANGITNPNLIFVGQRLVIPSPGAVVTPPSTRTTTPPPPSTSPGTYVVQPGDVLWRIALKFGVSASAIIAANNLTNPNRIFVGQRLIIPVPGAPPAPTTSPPAATATPPPTATLLPGNIYIVQPGDVLWRIALKFGVSASAIIAANNLTNPNRILVGQRLVIPIPGSGAPPAPTAGTPPPTSVPPPAGSGGFELGGQVAAFSAPDKMKQAGMLWVKKQIRWSPGIGASADDINDAHAKGFKILFSVVGHPEDISGGRNFDIFAAYVGELARLGADAIEVWNEMNLDREWPAGQINPTTYVDMLRRSYNAIKFKNANTLVISGAPSPTGAEGAFGLDRVWNDDRYIRGMAAAGAASYADCIGVHYNEGIISPRLTTGDPRDNYFTRYYQGMVSTYYNAFGGQRRLCFTELGYVSPEGYGPLPPLFGWGGNTSIAEQAQWLGEAASLAKSSGLVRLFIVYNVDFTVYGDDPQAGYAIIRADGSCPACATLGSVVGSR